MVYDDVCDVKSWNCDTEAAKTSCRMSSIRAPEFLKTAKYLPRFDSKLSLRPFVRELPKTKHLIQLLWVFSSTAVSSFSNLHRRG